MLTATNVHHLSAVVGRENALPVARDNGVVLFIRSTKEGDESSYPSMTKV